MEGKEDMETGKVMEFDVLEMLKKERLEEVDRLLESLEEGVQVRLDGGRWRWYKRLRLCERDERLATHVVVHDPLWGEVEFDVKLLTEVRDRRAEGYRKHKCRECGYVYTLPDPLEEGKGYACPRCRTIYGEEGKL